MKIRIKFSKHGIMKFIGHLDVMRFFQKAMRRADIAICYSEGYSPHQIMSFAQPLGVGLESDGEYLDIEVSKSPSSKEGIRRLNEVMAEGMEILSYRRLPETSKTAMSVVAAADYRIQFHLPGLFSSGEELKTAFSDFFSQEQIIVTQKTKKAIREKDIKPYIYESRTEGADTLFLKLGAGSAVNIKPELVTEAFLSYKGLSAQPDEIKITRLELYGNFEKEGKTVLLPLAEEGEDIE